jgi:hypothetical protein
MPARNELRLAKPRLAATTLTGSSVAASSCAARCNRAFWTKSIGVWPKASTNAFANAVRLIPATAARSARLSRAAGRWSTSATALAKRESASAAKKGEDELPRCKMAPYEQHQA